MQRKRQCCEVAAPPLPHPHTHTHTSNTESIMLADFSSKVVDRHPAYNRIRTDHESPSVACGLIRNAHGPKQDLRVPRRLPSSPEMEGPDEASQAPNVAQARSLSLSLSLSVYIYTHIYVCKWHRYIYIYIYVYIM